MSRKMQFHNINNQFNHTDLKVHQCGFEDCNPKHSWGPGVRDYFLIHYVFAGQGTFKKENKEYKIKDKQAFLICPNVVSSYQADTDNPWTYAWVGFNGLKAETYLDLASFNQENPVLPRVEDDSIIEIFNKLNDIEKLNQNKEIKLLGLLYLLISRLIETNGSHLSYHNNLNNQKEGYIKRAISFIENNYHRKITVSELANYVGIDRSYLWSIFKKKVSTSPQQFIIHFKINKARELMKKSNISIREVAQSVGYKDPLAFSKIFKKKEGISPAEFKKHFQK
ncbi:DNA-binding domain-containing protein, AraC-type [Halobacteroides halobius DSM 5150]|uniref:DNA-binding domain-containing protein, AraC-type n=1 Tax=Halobacteroides halobius (strain ATCC 35273 / DSM 5150 / MD-1) TaxID=748449 RepID=L0KCX8_HALHC|nr:AraC family transcriptional regulator [Halobacteroides halobius]AGB42395.1 DNA-binding domain-containing protein, AraC-type [Halobacteroides halobius DSM 5150]